MAEIKIRGKLEPVIVTNERAISVKKLWAGDPSVNRAPADRTSIIDLGSWCGELSRIVSIELETARVSRDRQAEDRKAQEQRDLEQWCAQTPEYKASKMSKFRMNYSLRLGHFKAEVPEDVWNQAHEIILDFYTKNPRAETYPMTIVEHLLPEKIGAESASESLAKKMKV